MTVLPHTTERRLRKIPQIPSVWEGDRRSLGELAADFDPEANPNGECIIWVDGTEGLVRAMEVVSTDMGPEAVVRTLLRAIEHPHSPAQPARPQKIIVRDRQMQFFLRGALQNLDINIDYVPQLPIIDELFNGFEAFSQKRPPLIPPQYESLLNETAYSIWKIAPWELMADHEILAIEVNHGEVGTLYACVMGMLGREYGIILYRSLESLKRFRQDAVEEDSLDKLEKIFLSQDCWFLNFEAADDEDDDEDINLADLAIADIEPIFGSIHPYEGMRPFLDEEEAISLYLALEAIKLFVEEHDDQLDDDPIGQLEKTYQLTLPANGKKQEKLPIKVATMPELAAELLTLSGLDDDDDDEDDDTPDLNEDLIPDNAFLSLGMMPWELLEVLQLDPKIYVQKQEIKPAGEGIPMILVQTTRPKGKEMIEQLKSAGGIEGITFNPGEDPFQNIKYDLGIIQTVDKQLHLFGEFMGDDPTHIAAKKKWQQRCQKTKGYCALVVAMGLTGNSRGNPQAKDMLAIFVTKSLSPTDLDLGVLQLMPDFDFDW